MRKEEQSEDNHKSPHRRQKVEMSGGEVVEVVARRG
jgi:hypothetical protein